MQISFTKEGRRQIKSIREGHKVKAGKHARFPVCVGKECNIGGG